MVSFLKCSRAGWSIYKSRAHVRTGYAPEKKVKNYKPPFFVYKKTLSLLTLESSYRCKDYWKERLTEDRAEMLTQSKLYWGTHARNAIGY